MEARGANSPRFPASSGMNTTREVPAAVEELVNGLTQSYGQIALILAHMMENGGDAPDAPPFDAVLRGMLGDVLSRLTEEHSVDDVATAAQMVQAANDVIAEDIYLVDEDKMDSVRQDAVRRLYEGP
jgi:hypothetical protein